MYNWDLERGWEMRLERQKGTKEFAFYPKCNRSLGRILMGGGGEVVKLCLPKKKC